MENSQETIDISFSDNFFSKQEHEIINDYCITSSNYVFGERDNVQQMTPPTGFVNQIPETHLVYKIINTILRERVEFIRDMKIVLLLEKMDIFMMMAIALHFYIILMKSNMTLMKEEKQSF